MALVQEMAASTSATYPNLALSVSLIEGSESESAHCGRKYKPNDGTIYELGGVTRALTGTILAAQLARDVQLDGGGVDWLGDGFMGVHFPAEVTFQVCARPRCCCDCAMMTLCPMLVSAPMR
jgi:hypothetical protein